MPMTHGGNWTINGNSCSRVTLGLTSTALPLSSTPCTAKTFLARSIPTVIMFMDFPFRGFDVRCKLHHGTRCRLRLPPQPRDGEVPFIRVRGIGAACIVRRKPSHALRCMSTPHLASPSPPRGCGSRTSPTIRYARTCTRRPSRRAERR